MKTAVSFLSLLAWLLTSTITLVSAQDNDALSLITPDAVGIITIKPAQIAKSKGARRQPLEVISAFGLEYGKVDPLKIERIDIIQSVPKTATIPMTVCVTHSEPIPKELLSEIAAVGPTPEKGVELWPVPRTPDFVMGLKGTNQLIIGPKLQVMRLIKTSPSDGELRQLVRGLGDDAELQIVVALEPVRDLLSSFTHMPQVEALPEMAANLSVIAQKARMLAIQMDLSDVPTTTYMLDGVTAADTTALARAMKSLIRQGMKTGIDLLDNELAWRPEETPKATLAYLKRLQSEVEANLDFSPEGTRLSAQMKGSTSMVAQGGVLVGLLLPAVQAARDAARRMQSMNNLKQLMLSILNYESTFKTFPNDMGSDPRKNNNNLSWRVHVLPFLEQNDLYKEFHLDEPWDSPHNIKLLERMPPTFKDPRSVTPPGHTVYQMPRGENCVLNPKARLKISSVTDGLSNTIAILISKDTASVPWTKPDDLDPITSPDSVATTSGITLAAMADGSVMTFNAPLPPEILKAMVQISDGAVIDFDAFTR